MAGYVIGSQAWYDATRQRIVDIGRKLRDPETPENKKQKLHDEQMRLVLELDEHSNENHVNNPIE